MNNIVVTSQTFINSKNTSSNRSGSPPEKAGFTLVELLVAIGLLVLLGTLLIMTFNDSLSLWSSGETQRKQYEEAHFLLRNFSKDLRQAWIPAEDRELSDTSLSSDTIFLASGFNRPENSDMNGRWLEVVRSKPGEVTGGDSLDDTGRLQRRVYVLLPNDGLYRASGPAGDSFAHHGNWGKLNDPEYIRSNFELIGPNVYYVDFKFWGPWIEPGEGVGLMKRWPVHSQWGGGNGVSLWWDSSRSLFKKFRMYAQDSTVSAVPAMIRIRLEMARRGRTNWPRLSGAIPKETDRGTPLRIGRSRSKLPSEGYYRIDDEWIRAGREDGTLSIQKRGARNTDPARHTAGTRVIAGNGFEITIYLPVYPGRSFYVRHGTDLQSGTR